MISVCHSRLHSHSMSTMHHISMVVVAFAVYYGSLKWYTRIGLIVGWENSCEKSARILHGVVRPSRQPPEYTPDCGALYRTRICKFGMSCQYGDRCFYAHSEEDIRPRAGSNASVHSCKLNESMHRSSRRSSAVLSEINYDMTSFIAESIGGASRRYSACTDNSENDSPHGNYPGGVPGGAVCVIGTFLPASSDLSDFSCESLEDFSVCGSLSPVSVASAACTAGYYYYTYITYLLSCYKPAVLYQLLKDAEPEFYSE